MSEIKILKLDEASRFLGISPPKVLDLASHGQLPARKIGGEWYFSDSTLRPYLKTYGINAYVQGIQEMDVQGVQGMADNAPPAPPAQ